MTRGLDMASQRRLHLLREAVPGVHDATATPRVMTSFRVERANNETRDRHRPQGSNADAWHALIQRSAGLSGTIKPDFRQMDTVLEMLCGDPVETDVATPGRVRRTYLLTESGARDIVTFSGEWGKPLNCEFLMYIILQSLSFRVVRGQTPSLEGNISMMSLKPGATGQEMTSGVAGDPGDPPSFDLPAQFPMLPQHFSVRRAATVAGLAAAAPIPKVHEISWGHDGLADPFMFFDEDDITSDSHVDGGEPQHTLSLAVAYDTDGVCQDLTDKANEEPAEPEAFEVRAAHKNGIERFQMQGVFSVQEPSEQSAAGNVYQKTFPLGVLINDEISGDDGPAMLRFITTTTAPVAP
jgi:hypothetical protein